MSPPYLKDISIKTALKRLMVLAKGKACCVDHNAWYYSHEGKLMDHPNKRVYIADMIGADGLFSEYHNTFREALDDIASRITDLQVEVAQEETTEC